MATPWGVELDNLTRVLVLGRQRKKGGGSHTEV